MNYELVNFIISEIGKLWSKIVNSLLSSLPVYDSKLWFPQYSNLHNDLSQVIVFNRFPCQPLICPLLHVHSQVLYCKMIIVLSSERICSNYDKILNSKAFTNNLFHKNGGQ